VSELLFVYGTLRPGAKGPLGAANPMMERLAANAAHLGRGQTPGLLYRVDWYPGLVLCGDGWVTGDVFSVTDASLLRVLDAYEDASTAPSARHEYLRQRVEVRMADASTLTAWTYVYNRAPPPSSLIAGGDFLAS
jgi:gamma-glutamylcyclotransferase (GGCT)/AIG2-like uncharacterized protein YtfP